MNYRVIKTKALEFGGKSVWMEDNSFKSASSDLQSAIDTCEALNLSAKEDEAYHITNTPY